MAAQTWRIDVEREDAGYRAYVSGPAYKAGWRAVTGLKTSEIEAVKAACDLMESAVWHMERERA